MDTSLYRSNSPRKNDSSASSPRKNPAIQLVQNKTRSRMAAMTPNKKIRNSDLETEIGLGQAAETTREKKMQINETEKSFAKAEEEHRRITSQSEAEVLKSLSDAKK